MSYIRYNYETCHTPEFVAYIACLQHTIDTERELFGTPSKMDKPLPRITFNKFKDTIQVHNTRAKLYFSNLF